uniref:Malonyl-CoA:ACP transacylase (MAT) domain-containing protein n=1 Tax=Timema monikensis TaxID=170555 RepID=A0A7R9ECT8_9NEOP|nr:unnamed protein product [Timema monikensis]
MGVEHMSCRSTATLMRSHTSQRRAQLDPKPRSPKWISSSVPENEWETPLAKYSSAEYHTNNLLSPVLFEESTKCIPNNAIVIEIAPHGLLQAIVRRSFAPKGHHIPLALRGHPNSTEFLLAAVGKMYMAGLLPKVSNLYPPVQYPVSRGTASLSSLVTWNHEDIWDSPLDIDTSKMEGFDTSVDHNFTICLNQERERMLEGYKLAGKVVLPLSYLLYSPVVSSIESRRALSELAKVAPKVDESMSDVLNFLEKEAYTPKVVTPKKVTELMKELQ